MKNFSRPCKEVGFGGLSKEGLEGSHVVLIFWVVVVSRFQG